MLSNSALEKLQITDYQWNNQQNKRKRPPLLLFWHHFDAILRKNIEIK